MMHLLTHLEPRREEAGCVLLQELEEVNEIIFFETGIVDVGYDINRHKKFVLRYEKQIEIGAYHCTFNRQAIFVFMCKSDCYGQSIKKTVWHDIMESYPNILAYLSKVIERSYEQDLKANVEKTKRLHLSRIQKRRDLQSILTVVPNTDNQQTSMFFSNKSKPLKEDDDH